MADVEMADASSAAAPNKVAKVKSSKAAAEGSSADGKKKFEVKKVSHLSLYWVLSQRRLLRLDSHRIETEC